MGQQHQCYLWAAFSDTLEVLLDPARASAALTGSQCLITNRIPNFSPPSDSRLILPSASSNFSMLPLPPAASSSRGGAKAKKTDFRRLSYRLSVPPHKTRPDSPVRTLQRNCDPSQIWPRGSQERKHEFPASTRDEALFQVRPVCWGTLGVPSWVPSTVLHFSRNVGLLLRRCRGQGPHLAPSRDSTGFGAIEEGLISSGGRNLRVRLHF